ncbi:cupin domain-containing protein [Sporomusa sphaeroides DSM 2875]|uniref:cupin domain-containing protein n=1 Tax=Sporomusa sphaeroides TaxID=47679 RepID=UPI002030D2B5|nr:cupin domain-containing protein [Sporomusa sphaeroides]MCM0759155.1 cupin domain-containing protein [Sporomusa sphaeroides DSM 2875]
MKNSKYVGKIDDLPLVDCSDFILGAEKRIVFGPDRFGDAYVMRCFTLEPYSVAPPNRHPWEHYALCIGGEGKFIVGNTEYDIANGYWMHVPGNISHIFWNTSDKEPLVIICIVPKGGDVNPFTTARPTHQECSF